MFGEFESGRICMHAPSSTGGHPLYVQELLTALVRHPRGGERFELVSSTDLAAAFRDVPYPVHAILPRLPHKSEFRSRAGWVLNRARHYPRRDRLFLDWLRGRGDITGVHFQEFSRSLPSLCRQIRRLGKTTFYTVHNIRPHAYPPLVPRRLWDHWNRRACLGCDRLFVLSDRLRDELADFLGTPHPPIDVMPHGVWSARDPGGAAPTPLGERLSWRRLLFFGTIRRNKGLDLLLSALEQPGQLEGFRVTIAGQPREADYFHSEVVPRVKALQARGLPVELIEGFVPDGRARELFAAHSAVLLPYTAEFTAQSGVVFLALAHEVPVVASEVGGLRDLFERFKIGTTFGEPTPAAFAAAVRDLFAEGRTSDPAALAELQGRIAAAKEHFGWSAAAGAAIESYAAGHPHPNPLPVLREREQESAGSYTHARVCDHC